MAALDAPDVLPRFAQLLERVRPRLEARILEGRRTERRLLAEIPAAARYAASTHLSAAFLELTRHVEALEDWIDGHYGKALTHPDVKPAVLRSYEARIERDLADLLGRVIGWLEWEVEQRP